VAGEGSDMQSGGEGRSTRWRADLPAADWIGDQAGRRAVAQLHPRKIQSVTAPVIFENRLATALIGPLLGAISGPAIARGTSFLKDKLGQAVFSPAVTITDDPHRPRGLASTPFDDEGVANAKRNLIDAGVLTTWLLNCASARQLGLESTGHASRGLAGPPGVSAANVTLLPGEKTRAELMKDAGAGLLVTSTFGPSLNGNTGDWSMGVSGLWFENGELAYPVNEITVAGNLIDLYQRMIPGSDLEFRGSANAPSILIDAMPISGL
jgi:PmbA protein